MTASSSLSSPVTAAFIAGHDAPALVLDTNAILDWLVFADSSMAGVGHAIHHGHVRWLMAPRMHDELAHVLARPLWSRWQADAAAVLAPVQHHIHHVGNPAPCGLHCTDADDQVFIDLALAQRARWLVTRDKALLRLRRQAGLRGTVVCRPNDWLACPPASGWCGDIDG